MRDAFDRLPSAARVWTRPRTILPRSGSEQRYRELDYFNLLRSTASNCWLSIGFWKTPDRPSSL